MISLIDHKTPIDLASVSVVAGTVVGMLPHIAALLSVIWSLIRIYETATVQNWLAKRKAHKDGGID